jgi:hypothetical protein
MLKRRGGGKGVKMRLSISIGHDVSLANYSHFIFGFYVESSPS